MVRQAQQRYDVFIFKRLVVQLPEIFDLVE